MSWKRYGTCLICGGKIYYNEETGEFDWSECICDQIRRCGKCIHLRNACPYAVGDDGCLGGPCPPCDMNCDECPYK